jgi:hypothetical protein
MLAFLPLPLPFPPFSPDEPNKAGRRSMTPRQTRLRSNADALRCSSKGSPIGVLLKFGSLGFVAWLVVQALRAVIRRAIFERRLTDGSKKLRQAPRSNDRRFLQQNWHFAEVTDLVLDFCF